MRLVAAMQLELDASGLGLRDLLERDRRVLALDDRHDLHALTERGDRRGQRRPRAAPGDDPVADEADGVAASEAALGVVARRRRHRTDPYLSEWRGKPLGVAVRGGLA